MELIRSLEIGEGEYAKRIEICRGDLARLAPAEAVDLLVVSAFPNDYAPTPTSLIGALHAAGVSVAALARDKELDLRDDLASWLSKDISATHPGIGFRRILCFEPAVRGKPGEVVGDLFRCLVNLILESPDIRSIAMPLLAAGDQRESPGEMLHSILYAAAHWLRTPLPLRVLRIVLSPTQSLDELLPVIEKFAPQPEHIERVQTAADTSPQWKYDYFISYAHHDSSEVDTLLSYLKRKRPDARLFLDRLELQVGSSWQDELDGAIETSRKVIVMYSPAYLTSKMCHEEFNMARTRHRESETGVLLPIYLRTTDLKLYHRSIQFIDCREADVAKLEGAADKILAVAF